MIHREEGPFELVVRNRPIDLAKLTGRLVREGVEFQRLTIATVGDKALIRVLPTSRKSVQNGHRPA